MSSDTHTLAHYWPIWMSQWAQLPFLQLTTRFFFYLLALPLLIKLYLSPLANELLACSYDSQLVQQTSKQLSASPHTSRSLSTSLYLQSTATIATIIESSTKAKTLQEKRKTALLEKEKKAVVFGVSRSESRGEGEQAKSPAVKKDTQRTE